MVRGFLRRNEKASTTGMSQGIELMQIVVSSASNACSDSNSTRYSTRYPYLPFLLVKAVQANMPQLLAEVV